MIALQVGPARLMVLERLPRWVNLARWNAREETKAWNFYHPDERRPVPALVEPEAVPAFWDELDWRLVKAMYGGDPD